MIILEIFAVILWSVLWLWWLWLPIILLPLGLGAFVHWRQELWISKNMQSVLLELRIPREIRRTPKAMEQVLAAMHTLGNRAGTFKQYYLDGVVPRWFSLEIATFDGEVHLYVRVPVGIRHMVEAPLFAYYPDIEVVEAPDYMQRYPQDLAALYESGADVWGTELVLAKDPSMPIRTYASFEAGNEDTQLDPIANLLEILGKLKDDEFFGMQIIIRPAGPEWRASGKAMIAALRAEKEAAVSRTPGELDSIKAIENNINKPAFAMMIRCLYLAPKQIFNPLFPGSGVSTALNQYTSLSTNSFTGSGATTKASPWKFPYLYAHVRTEYRKSRMLWKYHQRAIPPDTWFGKLFSSTIFHANFDSRLTPLNIEGLATIFHPPTAVVLTAPHIDRMSSRRVGPPAGLPIYGDDESIARFL